MKCTLSIAFAKILDAKELYSVNFQWVQTYPNSKNPQHGAWPAPISLLPTIEGSLATGGIVSIICT